MHGRNIGLSSLVIGLFLFSCQPLKAQVYVTKSGEKYHRASCQYLKSSKIVIELDKALALGYDPCKVCRPPVAKEQAVEQEHLVTPPTSSRCTALTQSGLRCKRNTTKANGRCWQHQDP